MPTRGAMRAGSIIFDKYDKLLPEEMAQIIDEETGLEDLLKAAKELIKEFEEFPPPIPKSAAKLKTAIAKAEGVSNADARGNESSK